MKMRFRLFLSFLLLGIASLAAAPGTAAQVEFSLNGRVSISLSLAWTERRDVLPPPPAPLAASAPPLRFSDILVLENRTSPGIIEIAFSDNPYIGSDSATLANRLQIGAGALQHFFYFFFPPPRACLTRLSAAFEAAKKKADEEHDRDDDRNSKRSRSSSLPDVNISGRCDFGPEMREFFAEQISRSLTFRRSGSTERVESQIPRFYLPPMEQHEIGDMTFLVFEAQAERLVTRDDVEKYGFADEFNGARVHYFWAIGARTPFPFIRDPLRKDLQLVHIVYSTLCTTGDARARFLSLLHDLHFQM
jgi:hypothetical protein